MLRIAAVVLVVWGSLAWADLASEERAYGEWAYKATRAVHDKTCTCNKAGDCTVKVSRDELGAQFRQFGESMKAELSKWPVLFKKMSAMNEADAHKYGAEVGKRYLDSLPKDEVVKWTRMAATCWPQSDPAPAADGDAPHDGSLDRTGTTDDLTDGKLDEASAIASFMQSCRKSGGTTVGPFCGCLGDYLRQSPASVIRLAIEASTSGNTTEFEKLPGVTKCGKWFADGARKSHPFAKKGMKLSVAVEAAFTKCRTTMAKGKVDATGVTFCNRHVATH